MLDEWENTFFDGLSERELPVGNQFADCLINLYGKLLQVEK